MEQLELELALSEPAVPTQLEQLEADIMPVIAAGPEYKNFVVFGTKSGDRAESYYYYRAQDQRELESVLLSTPLSDGGFVNFTYNEVDVFPEDVFVKCPHCNETHLNESMVTTISPQS